MIEYDRDYRAIELLPSYPFTATVENSFNAKVGLQADLLLNIVGEANYTLTIDDNPIDNRSMEIGNNTQIYVPWEVIADFSHESDTYKDVRLISQHEEIILTSYVFDKEFVELS